MTTTTKNQVAPIKVQSALTNELAEIKQVKDTLGNDKDLLMAYMLMKSEAFPDTKSIAEAVTKIEAGKAHGFDAATSLNAFDLIPSKDKDGNIKKNLQMRSIAIASKLENSKKYKVNILKTTDFECAVVVWKINVEGKWIKVGDVTYTMEDAKKGNLAGKFNWTGNPKLMLYYRAVSRAAKLYAPDVLVNVKTKEDIELVGEEILESPDEDKPSITIEGDEAESPDFGHDVKIEYILNRVPEFGYDYQSVSALAKDIYKVNSINDLTDDQRLAIVGACSRKPLNKQEMIDQGELAAAEL